MAATGASIVDNSSLLGSLKGQHLKIPSLSPLYDRWKSGISPQYEKLSEALNSQVDALTSDQNLIRKVKLTDFALLTCLCYPNADWTRLRVMGQFLIWLFLWDDEIDRGMDDDQDPMSLASNVLLADNYRSKSLDYVNQRFNVTFGDTEPPVPICRLLDELCPILTSSDQVNIPKFIDDIRLFIEANGVEQRLRLSGRLPSVEQYWDYRHGTGAMDSLCTLAQFVANTHLPEEIVWAPEVAILREKISENVLLMNDLFSLKKEIRDATPTNLVPVLIHNTGEGLEGALGHVVKDLYDCSDQFDRAAESLREKCRAKYPSQMNELDGFIGTFETFQTGLHTWSVSCLRYGIRDYQREDGSFLIPL